SSQELNLARQLILPARDHLVVSSTSHLERGMPERMTLSNLPTELLTRVLLFVPLRSLGQLMLCSHHLCEEIKFCAPVWRMHLAQFNAKKQPLLDAALSRQQRQSRSQPCPSTPVKLRLDSNEPCSDLQYTTVPDVLQSDTEDNVPTPNCTTQSYEVSPSLLNN
ncbi:uncharacterized protein DEA37_0005514, partial [Paragonimus westermani]